MFPLPPAQTHETRLPSEAGIPELWDTLVPVINGTCIDLVCSSLPHHGSGEPASVPGRCTGTNYFKIRLDGPGHGSRSRPRQGSMSRQGSRSRPSLTSRDFKDLGGCLHHHTSGSALKISWSFIVHFYSLSYGQECCLILVYLIPLLLDHV